MTAIFEFDGKTISVPPGSFPVRIEFGGKEYVIRITKNGKLIMN
jgi:hypothetical protein